MSNTRDAPKLNGLKESMKDETDFPSEKKETATPESDQKLNKSSKEEENKSSEENKLKSPENGKTKTVDEEKETMSSRNMKEKMLPQKKKGVMTSEKTVESLSPDKKEKSDDFETLFELYSNFGDRDGAEGITIKNIEKWFTQAGILDDKMEEKVAKADIIKCYSLIAKDKERLKLEEFKMLVKALAEEKVVKVSKMAKMLIDAGGPKISGVSDLLSTICKPCC